MKLIVCLEGRVAGTLETTPGQTEFVYEEDWLRGSGAYPLSLAMPLASRAYSGARVTNFLWGLLPDNDVILSAWARQFAVSARNPTALLAHVGEDCAGAVQFVREERIEAVLSENKRAPEVKWLTEAQLEERVRRLAGDASAARESVLEGQFSLSGAQAKTALYFDTQRRRWGIPQGRTPTTHILKPASNGFEAFAENEYFCLALARRVGLASANTQWRLIGDVPTLIAERYDRVQQDGRWLRVHQEDGCQALGIHPAQKYENEGGPGFPQLMRLLEGSDDPGGDRDRLMKTACFVYLVGATDAHAKNYSLLYAAGRDRPSIRLAPLYDIASAWPYPRRIPAQKMRLAMRVGRHYKVQEIQPRHFEELAKMCNYPPAALLDMLSDLAERLPDEASDLAQQVGGGDATREILGRLVDKVREQCRRTTQRM